jgi:hypothetical protein
MKKIILASIFLTLFQFAVLANDGCLPKDITFTEETPSTDGISNSENTLPNGSVFVDHTLSMEGFVVRDNENVSATDYNYLRAMDELAFQLSLITESQTFHRYGLDIEAITSEQLNKSTSTDFYQCPASIPSSECRNIQSDLESVLTIAAMKPENFYVVVTDLFLKNTQFFDPKSNIKKSLSKVFNQGQSIGIYGVKSKFNGRVSGLPSGSIYENANERAFFILMIGEKSDVLKFRDNLEKDVFYNVSDDSKSFTIYTNDFVLNKIGPSEIKKDDLFPGPGASLKAFYPEKYNFFHQYELRHSHDPFKGLFDLYEIQLPDTILLTDFTTNVTLYQTKDIRKCDSWKKLDNIEGLVTTSQDENMIDLEVFGPNNLASAKFKRKRNYIANVKVIANNIGLNDDNFWLKDWSFTSVDEAQIIQSSPIFFPTLNLSRFATMLENIQRSEFEKIELIEFNIAVRME